METDELAKEAEVATSAEAEYLYVKDLQELLRVGYNKARLTMNELPYIRIGKRDAVLKSQLTAYMFDHGGIRVKWPRRKR